MIDTKYAYVLLAGLFLLGWILLYILRRDERQELIILSFPMALFGIAADVLYVKDWWNPLTIFGTPPISGEAIIAAFGIVGVGAVLPEFILRLKDTSPHRIFTRKEIDVFCVTIFTMASLFYGSFFLLGLNSFVATIVALVAPTLFMWRARKDLVHVAVLNGLFFVAFCIIVYGILDYLTPGWIEEFYLFQNTPPWIFMNIPIDDIVFYFCAGLFFGTFYEWWQNIRRIPLRKGHRSIVRWWQIYR